MALSPQVSFGASLALVAFDFSVYSLHMPKTADIKASPPNGSPIESARKAATWTAIGASAAISLLAKDPNVFIFGAGFAVILDWFYRHANHVAPASGQVVIPEAGYVSGGYS